MSGQYSIKIPVFEGPLDLLLHLIKKNEIDVYDIPIALITGQYLEYIGLMKELNLEVAGEFLVMAATLIHIKSRMLLPQEERAPDEEDDPRLELVQRLIEYQAFKEASLALGEFGQKWSAVQYRPDDAAEEAGDNGDQDLPFPEISLFDLITAFRKILEKAPPELQDITRQTLSLKDGIARILEMLEEKETLRFEELFEGEATKSHLIVSFVAVLEILKLGLARVYQEEKFGPIWVIRAHAGSETGEDGVAPVARETIATEAGTTLDAVPPDDYAPYFEDAPEGTAPLDIDVEAPDRRGPAGEDAEGGMPE